MKQLKALKVIKKEELQLNTSLFHLVIKAYNSMGDNISLQYGGSIAHHSSLNKKKSFLKNSLPELLTSVKRHWANNFKDPERQKTLNLFLGIYVPYKVDIPLW